jgi:hypothetical protein
LLALSQYPGKQVLRKPETGGKWLEILSLIYQYPHGIFNPNFFKNSS